MATKDSIFKSRNYSIFQLTSKQDELNEYIIKGWKGVLTDCHFQTEIIDEASEFLGSGVSHKWWKYTDPATFDQWNLKIEVIDIMHFYLSCMILWEMGMDTQREACSNDADIFGTSSFDQFSSVYIGTDEGPTYSAGPVISGENVLDHCTFVGHVRSLLTNQTDVYKMIRILDGLVSTVGLTSEEMSAIFAAKSKLNEIRASSGYKDGTYVKVDNGVEDNQRLQPLVDAFLADPTMTLETLRQNVFDEFYDVVTV